jgi:DNA polymerase III sliding clamp (beta) subunit (PCNA family)
MSKNLFDQSLLGTRIHADNLQFACDFLKNIIPARPSYPILQNAIIAPTSENGLCFHATDFELSVSMAVGAKSFADWQLCLPVKQLAELVKASESDVVNIHYVPGQDCAILTYEGDNEFNGQSVVKGLPVSEYPNVLGGIGNVLQGEDLPKEFIREGKFTIALDTLVKMSKFALQTALDDKEYRENLKPVYLFITGNTLRMVSTDGHALSYCETKVNASKDMVIPMSQRALTVLGKIKGKMINELTFEFFKRKTEGLGGVPEFVPHVNITAGAMSILCLCPNTEMPDYQSIIPTKAMPFVATLSGDTFIKLFKMQKANGKEGEINFMVKIDGEDQKLIFSNLSAEKETKGDELARNELPCQVTQNGRDTQAEMCLDMKLLGDFAALLKGQEIKLGLRPAEKEPLKFSDGFTLLFFPIVIDWQDKEGVVTGKYLLMPKHYSRD